MLDAASRAMTALGAPRYSVLLRIDAATAPIRIWAGIGPLPIEADDVETTASVYQGVGILGEIPPLRQLVGGGAERVDFSLAISGGPLFDLLDEEADEVLGVPVNVGAVFFDDEWQMVAPPSWLWDGTADVPAITRSTDQSGDIFRGLSLSVGSAFVDRSRAELTYFTDAEQRRRSPDDRFCERVSIYDGSHTIKWL